MQCVQVLFGLSTKGQSFNALGLLNMPKKLIDRSVQTECESPTHGVLSKNKVGRPRKVRSMPFKSPAQTSNAIPASNGH